MKKTVAMLLALTMLLMMSCALADTKDCVIKATDDRTSHWEWTVDPAVELTYDSSTGEFEGAIHVEMPLTDTTCIYQNHDVFVYPSSISGTTEDKLANWKINYVVDDHKVFLRADGVLDSFTYR